MEAESGNYVLAKELCIRVPIKLAEAFSVLVHLSALGDADTVIGHTAPNLVHARIGKYAAGGICKTEEYSH